MSYMLDDLILLDDEATNFYTKVADLIFDETERVKKLLNEKETKAMKNK